MERESKSQKKLTTPEQKALQIRTKLFLDEIKLRGGYKKLYLKEHTNVEVQKMGITENYFNKLLNRMFYGGGLYCKPALLSAVLKDMSYPADCLFFDDTPQPNPAVLKLGPGVAAELQEIMARAFTETSKKPIRQVGIKRRIMAAYSVLSIAKVLHEENNYTSAFQRLFYCYSGLDTKTYPHSRTTDISYVDRLCKHCMSEKNNDSGKLLVLSYLIYEIHRLCNSLIYYTVYGNKLPLTRKPMVLGFDFIIDISQNDILNYLNNIDNSFNILLEKCLTKRKDEIITDNGIKGDIDVYMSLENTKITQSLQYAQSCLEKLLKFDMSIGTKSSSGSENIDVMFDILVGLKPEISPHYTVKFDSDLKNDFECLVSCLANFFDNTLKI